MLGELDEVNSLVKLTFGVTLKEHWICEPFSYGYNRIRSQHLHRVRRCSSFIAIDILTNLKSVVSLAFDDLASLPHLH